MWLYTSQRWIHATKSNEFKYFQFILGNAIGFIIIATVLLPLYYRMKLTSIYTYKNKEGEVISSTTTDQVVADSLRTDIGWIRRPSDRLLTMGLFLQDYLSTNKNFKVHLNMIYGSNMTYNIPNNERYRNALIIEPYIRVDVGFSALLLSEKSLRRSHSPFRNFDNIWASLEVFNIIDRANVISYQLVKDFSNNIFSIPNRLTPRLINFKLLARF